MSDDACPLVGTGQALDPSILKLLREDVRVNVVRPSASRAFMGLLNNPGLLCVMLYRISAGFYARGKLAKPVGIIVWRLNVFLTGAYLHPAARVGPGLRLPHPVGVVVGAGVQLGANVTLYQNTTIGISSQESYESYPTIQDATIVYCGAVIVGAVRVGANAVIGANAVVVKDVPAGATVVGIPARILQPSKTAPLSPDHVSQ